MTVSAGFSDKRAGQPILSYVYSTKASFSLWTHNLSLHSTLRRLHCLHLLGTCLSRDLERSRQGCSAVFSARLRANILSFRQQPQKPKMDAKLSKSLGVGLPLSLLQWNMRTGLIVVVQRRLPSSLSGPHETQEQRGQSLSSPKSS